MLRKSAPAIYIIISNSVRTLSIIVSHVQLVVHIAHIAYIIIIIIIIIIMHHGRCNDPTQYRYVSNIRKFTV